MPHPHPAHLSIAAAILACVSLAPQACGQADQPAIELELAKRCFEEAAALSRADAGSLWGQPLYGPMLFMDPATRQVVANQRDSAGTLSERAGVWVGTLPQEFHPANTAITWNGMKWTMVMWPLSDDRYARGRLLMHECFHRIQDDLGLSASDTDNGHLDSRDGRIWMRMEWRALREALIGAGEARRQALEDALVFRAQRRAIFPSGAEAERLMELNEGLAEYTGFRLSGLPAPVLADRAAVQLAQHDQSETFVRSFAYASGPAYGVLLDESGVEWRRGLTVHDDLAALLATAMKIGALPAAGDLEREAARRAERYDDGRVIARETRRDEERQRRQAGFRARFVDGPILELPASGDIRYSFNPNMVEALPGVGTVYLMATVSDALGTLSVHSGGALMLREAGNVKSFRVPAPADPAARPLAGEGWTLELAEGWIVKPGGRAGDWVIARDE